MGLARKFQKIKWERLARKDANYYVFSIEKEKKKEIVDRIKEIVNNDDIKISLY